MLATCMRRFTSRLRLYWVDALYSVGRAQQAALRPWKSKHRQAFRQALFQPRGKLRGRLRVLLHRPRKQYLGLSSVLGAEDSADVRRHLPFHVLPGHIRRSVLLQVELASLPRDAPEHRDPRRFQPFMGVTRDQPHPAQAPRDKALQELLPVDFVFGQGHRDPKYGALAYPVHAHGNEYGGFLHQPILAHPLVASIEEDIWAGRKRPLTPCGKRFVQ